MISLGLFHPNWNLFRKNIGLVGSWKLEIHVHGPFYSYRKTRWWQLKYFLFSPLPGEMIQFDEHIFQMG